ncbi:hypothetical protein CS369_10645 [Candidatus Symbiopectobacterium sp. 'North America']|nr:hypothetical protein [Candidatus Symbiopectobacterium sp. 'North America']
MPGEYLQKIIINRVLPVQKNIFSTALRGSRFDKRWGWRDNAMKNAVPVREEPDGEGEKA